MDFSKDLIYFVVLLNPFAQAIALWDLMQETGWREFLSVYGKATLLSFGVYLLFIIFGDSIVDNVFQIRLSALKIFGGIIIMTIGFRNIMLGVKNNLLLNAKVSDLAQEISLPYIIGPATLWLSILMGKEYPWYMGASGIGSVMLCNWALLVVGHYFFSNLKRSKETLVGKYLSVLMRTTSLFIGAIGVDMVMSGLQELITETIKTNI
ncbi:MarC family protein [bacterium]|nr:MarC family protein [bacterium]